MSSALIPSVPLVIPESQLGTAYGMYVYVFVSRLSLNCKIAREKDQNTINLLLAKQAYKTLEWPLLEHRLVTS
jgi:hypothetical protein